jgi:cytochrome P450
MRPATVSSGARPSVPLPATVQSIAMLRCPFWTLERLRARYGASFTVRVLQTPPLVFLNDPEDLKTVFAASPEVLCPGEGGAVIAPIVGSEAFILADGERHARGRARLAASFSGTTVQTKAPLVREIAERHIAGWPRETPIALHDRLRMLTLDVILRTLFGPDLARAPELQGRILSMLDVTATTALTLPRTRSLPGTRGPWRRFLRDRGAVDAMLLDLIERRRSTAEERDDVLSVLTAARDDDGKPLSQGHIRDQLMSLILAGHETTAAQLSWAFQLLAHHPRVTERIAGELDAGGETPYLTATIQEILRHRPVFVFAIPRALRLPFTIGTRTYHPGSHLLPCIYLLHHDADAFPDPHAFRPERFLDAPPGPNWIPWGGGRRRCPGRRLALLEIETVLKIALSTTTVRPASCQPERPSWRSVIVTPRAGCRVILDDRTPSRRVDTEPRSLQHR